MVEIYGTLGPACVSQGILQNMFQAGLTGMRLNLSHTGLRESAGLVEHFRKAAAAAGVVPQLFMCAEHGTSLAGASPVTGIYRQV